MGNAFTHSWRYEAWKLNAVHLQGQDCDHSAGNAFKRAGVKVGDTIYVVANAHGAMRLAGKMTVGEFVSQREAERRLGYELWRAREHVMASGGTKLDFTREVPLSVVRRLRFGPAAAPLKLTSSARLHAQAFRNIRRLTPKSAQLLDRLITESRRSPVRAPELIPEQLAPGEQFPAGAATRITVNRFERDAKARRACLAYHGCRCKACDFNFADVYGELGQDFIHVHHRLLVARLPKGYRIKPVSDLCPVCPNCHSMLHRTDPPMNVETLRDVIARQRGRRSGAK